MAVVAKDPTTEAPPPEDFAEVSLPTGMTADELAKLMEPEPEAETEPEKPEDKPAAEPAADKTPQPPVQPPAPPQAPEPPKAQGGDLRKALKEERGKRKKAEERAQNLWDQIKKEKQQGADRLGARPEPGQVRIDPARIDQIAKLAEESEAAGKGVRPAIEAAIQEAHRITQDAVGKVLASLPGYLMRVQEQDFREQLSRRGENYDEILEKSGIFSAVRQDAQGNFADPYVARVIYSSANPARRAYELAVDKLKAEGKSSEAGNLSPDDEDDDTPVPTAPSTPQAVAPAPAAPAQVPTAEAVAEARRAGAREVAESVAHNTKRPQGVRLLRDAGQPVRVGMDLAYWNKLKAWMDQAERNPMGAQAQKFLDFMQANPESHQFLMAGPPKA